MLLLFYSHPRLAPASPSDVLGTGTDHLAKARSGRVRANGEPAPTSAGLSSTASVANGPREDSTEHGSTARQPAAVAPTDSSGAAAGLCRAAAMRRAEFGRLDGTVYVDHAGTTLYSDRQLQETYQVGFARWCLL